MDWDQCFEERRDEILRDYFTYLRFKTISSESGNEQEMDRCVQWLRHYLEPLNFKVSIWRSYGHPVVLAQSPPIEGAKTLLIYNHYDVQPVDPLDLWDSPPFTPTERGGMIYARGANDDKGQSMYVLAALKAYWEQHGKFPLNVKLLIEGDEEVGSRGLDKILADHAAAFQADYLTIVDLGILSREKPSLTFGVRGLVTMDLTVEGPNHDMHSGTEGGVVLNPIHALCALLSQVRDASGKVTIPGFYDGVKELTPKEQKKLYRDFDEAAYLNNHGVLPRGGEKGYTPFERAWIRPTLEVNGILGGYTGNGFKTVIPARASAKISCRLVDGQNPQRVGELVKTYFESCAPEGTKVKVHLHSGMGLPVKSRFDSPLIHALVKSYEEVFKKEIVFTFEGGSIPIASDLARLSGADIAFVGLGLPTDRIHAPNEHFDMERLKQGFCIVAKMLDYLTVV